MAFDPIGDSAFPFDNLKSQDFHKNSMFEDEGLNAVGVASLHNNMAAASIVAVLGSAGLIANVVAICIIYRLPSLHNSFGYLCLIHATGEAGVLCVFVLWVTPLTFLERSVSKLGVNAKLGHLVLFFYFITIYSQLCQSVNRFVAIASPFKYRRFFDVRYRCHVLVVIVVIACLHSIIYFFEGCDFFFDSEFLVWSFADNSCGHFISFYIDFLHGMVLMGVVICTDVCTACLIHRNRRRVGHQVTAQQREREIRFFLQVCISSVLYTLMLCSFHFVYRFTENPWLRFLSTTVAWELCHVLDGLCIIAFNATLRSKFVLTTKSKSSSSPANPMPTPAS